MKGTRPSPNSPTPDIDYNHIYLRRTERNGAEGGEGGEQLRQREGLQEGSTQQRQEGGQLCQAGWAER